MGDSRTSFRRLRADLINLVFPPRCAGCGRLGSHWCEQCQSSVVEIAAPFCMKCGYTLRKGQACPSCAEHAYTFTQARSWAVYQDQLREAILFLKRKPNESLAETLGSGLARILKQEDWKPDIIVPIPLFADRLKTRGYNQADLLARAVGQDLGIPVSPNALLRRRSTRAQMDLHPGQRWENVRGAFSADRASVAGARVLLIDDIITTGATMHAAATALEEADASEVYALSLARALG